MTVDDAKYHLHVEMRVLGHITTDVEDMRLLRTRNIGRDFFYFKAAADDLCTTQALFDFAVGYYRDNDRLLSREALITELNKRGGTLKEGSEGARMVALLTKCQAMTLDKDSFPALLDKLREDVLLRVLGNVSTLIAQNAKTPSKTFEAAYNYLSTARIDLSGESSPTQIFNLATGMGDMSKEYFDRKLHPEKYMGLEVGWGPLDKATKGFKKSTLVLVIGEVGKGKSTILLNWAAEVNNGGKNIIFFSFEMPMWQVKARWVAREMRIPYSGFMHAELSEDEEDRLHRFYEDEMGGDVMFDKLQNKSRGYFIVVDQPDDTSPAFVEQMVKQCNSLYGPCDAIFADYLNNMKVDGISRNAQWWEHTGLAAAGLRRIARIHDLVAFSAQQINREGLKYARSQMKDENDYASIIIRPEHIEGWKAVINESDSVIGFIPDDDIGRSAMHIQKIKGRDWTCEPFSMRFLPEMCLVEDQSDPFEMHQALFADNKTMSILADLDSFSVDDS